jgi:LacI family transcriptional regulator
VRKKITIKDIADELATSKSTVYKAIHNKSDVSQEMLRKVNELLVKYNYKPNKIAKSLSLNNKTQSIGIVLYSTPHFYWDIIKKGMDDAACELSDYNVELIYKIIRSRNSSKIVEKMNELVDQKVKAMIIVPLYDADIINKINQIVNLGIPVVTITDDVEESKRVFYVGPMQKQSGRTAGELMGKLLMGRGSIVVIKPDLHSFSLNTRMRGFRDVIVESYPQIKIVKEYVYNLKEKKELISIINEVKNNKEISGLYVTDGGRFHEIGNIVKKLSPDRFILIGHEMWKGLEKLLIENDISACVSHDTYHIGFKAIKSLFSYFYEGDRQIPDRIFTRTTIIMKENIFI